MKVQEILNLKATRFPNMYISSIDTLTIGEYLNFMKGDESIMKLHKNYLEFLNNKESYSSDEFKSLKAKLKGQFKAVTFSASYSNLTREQKLDADVAGKKITNRRKSNLDTYNKIMSIDIDHIKKEQFKIIWENLKNDKKVICQFVSPSGDGIKFLILFEDVNNITTLEEDPNIIYNFHRNVAFPIIEKYYKKQNIIVDPACKDVGRLVYLPSIRFNEEDKKKFNLPDELFHIKPDNFNITPIKIKETAEMRKINKKREIQEFKSKGKDLALEEILSWCKDEKTHIFNLSKKTEGVFNLWRKFAWSLYKYFKDDRALDYLKAFTLHELGYESNSSISGFDEEEIDKRWQTLKDGFDETTTYNIKPKIAIDAMKYGFEFSDPQLFKEWLHYGISDDKSILNELDVKLYKDIRTNQYYIDYPDFNFVKERYTNQIDATLFNKIDEKMSVNYQSNKWRMTKDDIEVIKKIDILKDIYDDLLKDADEGEEFQKFIDSFVKCSDTERTIIEEQLKIWMLTSIDGHLLSNSKYNNDIKVKTKISPMVERFNKYIMVLSGGHSTRKSTSVQTILEPFHEQQLFGTNFSWTSSADDKRAMVNYAFIFDDELKASSKADIKAIKEITGNVSLNWVEKYKEYFTDTKRIASFITSTNEETVYNDDTGNVRFFVININSQLDFSSINFRKVWGWLYKIWLAGETGYEYQQSINFDNIIEHNTEFAFESNLKLAVEHIFVPSEDKEMTYHEIIEFLRIHYDIKSTKPQLAKMFDQKRYKRVKHRENNNKWTTIKCMPKPKKENKGIVYEKSFFKN